MSVALYDNALINNLRDQLADPRITFITPELAFRQAATVSRDKVKLPLISLLRLNYSLVEDNFAKKYTGLNVRDPEIGTRMSLQAIQIKIEWQLDIYAHNYEVCDDLTREIIFYLRTNPTLKVTVPYGANKDLRFNVLLDNEIIDNTDLAAQPDKGQYVRATLRLYTDEAYLFKTTIDTLKSIEVKELQVKNGLNVFNNMENISEPI